MRQACGRRARRGGLFRAAAALLVLAGAAPLSARADDHPVFLQWFETKWSTMEYRIPDFFMAGYDSTWLPPPWKAADPTSAGFDTFDRFDLGSPGSETAYGTREGMRAVIEEFHQAGALVYIDLVMNHNSGRNNSDGFFNAGGYPGFAMRIGSDFWGDFHDGTRQSQQPNPGPNDAPYDLWTGDLVGLIDIAQEKNYQYIRNPVTASPPSGQVNIPPGTLRNRPDPFNRQFYPDTTLPSRTFTNPLAPAGQQQVTLYPFNPADATQTDSSLLRGVPVMENSTAYLLRTTRWMLEVMKVDGFRLDAAKHIPQWFWNQYWDSAVFQGRIDFAGNRVTPFSFGEIVDSNGFTQTYTRKDGFGNRDALDLNGAGALRDLLNQRGFGSWDNVINAHLDSVDGGGDTVNQSGNNGSLGVTHVFSHDNGSAGNGSSIPPLPGPSMYALPEHCYLLFRTCPPIVYHNSREFAAIYTNRGFWPREGSPTALGNPDRDLVKLVQLSDGYARGDLRFLNYTDPQNQSRSDVLVFERRRTNGQANVLVGVNDSYLTGVTQRSVQTSFPANTRLRELTGNAGDPTVDPGNQIPQTLVVDSNQRVLLTVPYNQSTVNGSTVQHHKGYVVYGPATPSGTLSITKPDGSAFTGVIPADPASVPAYKRRLTPITIVDTPTFSINLTTTKTDPDDPAWDDRAIFRIDGGFPSAGSAPDFNGQNNGPDFPNSDAVNPRFENFVTTNLPLATTANATNGVYKQTINTSSLSEGIHYILVRAFRQRPVGTDPLFTDFRTVIYVDRTGPAVTMVNPTNSGSPSVTVRIKAADRTATNVWIMANLPQGTDPLTQLTTANQGSRYDRFEWRRTFSALRTGANTITVVATEATGKQSVTTFTVNVTTGLGDINRDGVVDMNDLYAGYLALSQPSPPYDAVADIDNNGVFNLADLQSLERLLRPQELQNQSKPQR